MLRAVIICALGLAVLPSCDRPVPKADTPAAPEPTRAQTLAPTFERADQGEQLVRRFECARCHTIENVDPPPTNMNCTGCHREIITRTYPDQPEEYLAMWDRGLVNMRDVPSLVDIDRRLRRDWFVEFLIEPHDLRPRLGATMPRMRISRSQAETLADYFGLTKGDDERPAGDPTRGRDLAEKSGCGSCHVMTGLQGGLKASPIPVEVEPARLRRAMSLAPDLRFTRERHRFETLVEWLQQPRGVKSDALMPDLKLSREDARHIAAFLTRAPLEAAESPRPPKAKRPAPLDRPVRWKEVQTEIFDAICLHCHSDPNYNDGDGGPGHTGGFGFSGKGIDFSTYRRAVYGEGEGDTPRSIYAPTDDGTPRVIAHMLARHDEVAGRTDGELLGMPLGFPPIEMERIRLLDTWIRQGMPK